MQIGRTQAVIEAAPLGSSAPVRDGVPRDEPPLEAAAESPTGSPVGDRLVEVTV